MASNLLRLDLVSDFGVLFLLGLSSLDQGQVGQFEVSSVQEQKKWLYKIMAQHKTTFSLTGTWSKLE